MQSALSKSGLNKEIINEVQRPIIQSTMANCQKT